jgi:hypothetical protein
MTTTRTPVANRFQPIYPQPDDAPPMPNQTDKTLTQIRTELLTTFNAADWESCSHLVGRLRDTDASHALKVGDTRQISSCQTPTAVSTPPSSCAATDPCPEFLPRRLVSVLHRGAVRPPGREG